MQQEAVLGQNRRGALEEEKKKYVEAARLSAG